jgi:hypothetical protein
LLFRKYWSETWESSLQVADDGLHHNWNSAGGEDKHHLYGRKNTLEQIHATKVYHYNGGIDQAFAKEM